MEEKICQLVRDPIRKINMYQIIHVLGTSKSDRVPSAIGEISQSAFVSYFEECTLHALVM